MTKVEVKKRFSITFSKKFANGAFASITFEGSRAVDTNPEDSAELEEFESALFEEVKASVFEDVKNTKDTIAKSIFEDVKNGIKLDNRVKQSKKDLNKK